MQYLAEIRSRKVHPASGLERITLTIQGDYQFAVGQYLSVLHPNGTAIPLSIASTPRTLPLLELHYQPTPEDVLSQAMDECLAQPVVTISAAQGTVRCPAPDRSLTIIAGGSGASIAFSCAQHRTAGSATTVLWCVDQAEQLYAEDELAPLCDLHTVVDARRGPDNQSFSVLRTLAPTDDYVLAGSPGFVYAMTDVLSELGVADDRLQSDVYAYAPRETPLPNPGSSGCGRSGNPPTDCSR